MVEMKRFFDLALSLIAIVLLSPVMLVAAIVVKRTSPGGALFVQRRVGRHEKPFNCYKFRTMVANSPNVGSHVASASWITPVGRTLRQYKLDELPQLFNVIKGDMSLVGPRPCLPSQDAVIAARRQQGVFSIRPGVTGPAQLAGIDMSTPEKLAQADRGYVDGNSLLGDFVMLIATATGKGVGDAARS